MKCAHVLVSIEYRRGPKKTPARRHVFGHVRCEDCGKWLSVRWVS